LPPFAPPPGAAGFLSLPHATTTKAAAVKNATSELRMRIKALKRDFLARYLPRRPPER
jgi:hypothetical protein